MRLLIKCGHKYRIYGTFLNLFLGNVSWHHIFCNVWGIMFWGGKKRKHSLVARKMQHCNSKKSSRSTVFPEKWFLVSPKDDMSHTGPCFCEDFSAFSVHAEGERYRALLVYSSGQSSDGEWCQLAVAKRASQWDDSVVHQQTESHIHYSVHQPFIAQWSIVVIRNHSTIVSIY